MRPRLGLTARLTLTFVLFAATVVAALGTLAYRSGRDALRTAAVSHLWSVAIEKQAALEAWIREARFDITAIVRSPALRDQVQVFSRAAHEPVQAAALRQQLRSTLQRELNERTDFSTLMLIDATSGRVIAATTPEEEGTFKENRLYFIHGQDGPYTQNADYSLRRQVWEIVIAGPVRSSQGQTLAVLAGILDPQKMNAIVSRRSGLHRSTDAFLVNQAGLFVTRPRLLGQGSNESGNGHAETLERIIDTRGGAVLAEDHRGVPAIAVYRWLPARALGLIVQIDQAEAFAPAVEFGRQILLLGILVLLIASALALAMTRAIIGPVLALRAAAVRFGQGDWNVGLPERSHDELGELAREFNAMAAKIKQNEAQLQYRAAELEATNKELEAFSYSVSHDLRAPLRAVSGFAELLLSRPSVEQDAESTRLTSRIVQAGKRMGKLIDDLLAFSRTGRTTLRHQQVDLNRLVGEIRAELQSQMPGRDIVWSIDPLPDVRGDESMLRQVWLNLIDNALKYSRGRLQTRIEIGCSREPQEWVFFVRDNGVGFEMQYAKRLFGVFQRLHRSDEFEGTGIGLANVRRIIERHAGRTWAESTLDQGATFYFSLPAGDPRTPAAKEVAKAND